LLFLIKTLEGKQRNACSVEKEPSLFDKRAICRDERMKRMGLKSHRHIEALQRTKTKDSHV